MTFDGSQKVIGKGAQAFRFVHQADTSNTSIPPLDSTAGFMLTDKEKSQVLLLMR